MNDMVMKVSQHLNLRKQAILQNALCNCLPSVLRTGTQSGVHWSTPLNILCVG